MRVLVTGATGFVGRWLSADLAANGHQPIPAPGRSELDICDRDGLLALLEATRPDAVVHLAAVAFGPDARNDPAAAFRINVDGTLALYQAIARSGKSPVVLVSGSSEQYGAPRAEDLPLAETAALAPRHPYAVSKVAQEAVALEYGRRFAIRTIVTRAFNHTGPGQRPVFAVPAFARRILAVRQGAAGEIPVGNVDVRRDLGDVRDVVRAYRLLIEDAAKDSSRPREQIFNVATGVAMPVRHWIERLAELARVEARMTVDPELTRPDDPPEIRGDASRLEAATGWRPAIGLDATLADVLADAEHESSP